VKLRDDAVPGCLLEKKKVLVFDFDGTIANTEPLQWKAYNACLGEYGITLTRGDMDRYMGYCESEIYAMMKADFGIGFDDNVFFAKRFREFMALVEQTGLRPFGYFMKIIREYEGKRIFILSAQKREVIDKLLDIWNISDVFEKIISVSDGRLSKELVLGDTSAYFGAAPSDIMIFEDSPRVLSLARKEGIHSVGIEHDYNAGRISDSSFIIQESRLMLDQVEEAEGPVR
jgi:beta-phosphoglucomutase-like phosphatase (HAD superfamily)